MYILHLNHILYYSILDEEMFFLWLKKIPSIKMIGGFGYTLTIHFSTKLLPDEDLRELIAVLFRHQLNMRQLQIFLTDANRAWFFENKSEYWWHSVFGRSYRQPLRHRKQHQMPTQKSYDL